MNLSGRSALRGKAYEGPLVLAESRTMEAGPEKESARPVKHR
jgi:hypothetical protein